MIHSLKGKDDRDAKCPKQNISIYALLRIGNRLKAKTGKLKAPHLIGPVKALCKDTNFHTLRHPYVSLTTKKLVPFYEKISCVLYTISIRFPGKTNTFSISSSDSASVSLSASAIS